MGLWQVQRFIKSRCLLCCTGLPCFRSHHDAWQRLQHSCAGPCCLLPRAWAMKKIYRFFPVHRPIPTYRLAMSFLRHPRSLEVRAWENKKVKQRHFACCVGCYFNYCILHYLVISVYLNNALTAVSITYQFHALIPSILRLDSKQLVSEVLQGVLSKKMI